MLALPRSTRVAHRFSLNAHALSAVAHSASAPNSGAEQPSKPARRARTRLTNSSAECMFVYPWNGIRSSAEGLAIAQAVQAKYGPAKEVVFPRCVFPAADRRPSYTQDSDCVGVFHSFFWLVFDNPDVHKRLPEAFAQIRVHVPDLPRGDGNVGLEEMMRGLGFSTTDGEDAPRESPTPPPDAEAAPKDASEAPPEGHKSLDIRVEWARYGPSEVLGRRRPASVSLPDEALLPNFASAWLAFDGFSPESARGPHTPNLLRAREKWRNLAPNSDNDLTTTAAAVAESPSHVPVEDEKESATAPCEWVPITLSTTPFAQRPGPGGSSAVPKNDDTSPALTLDDSTLITSTTTSDADSIHHAEHAANTTTDDAAWPTPSLRPAGTDEAAGAGPAPAAPAPAAVGLNNKMNRRERILHLARQNARTPLPEPAEEPQPPPSSEGEKLDEESERRVKERTIRDRLWRLVGRNF
ncbi:hypothetical protein BJV74DRAFT_882288 [Russula compacta]|nr:hypothetical protein BJV74DRAFT_882288 [Russula compacta]